jgi:hypothetical protein
VIIPEKAFATEPQRHGEKHFILKKAVVHEKHEKGLDDISISFLFTIPDLRIFEKLFDFLCVSASLWPKCRF